MKRDAKSKYHGKTAKSGSWFLPDNICCGHWSLAMARTRLTLGAYVAVTAGATALTLVVPVTAQSDRVFRVTTLAELQSRVDDALPGDHLFLTDGVRESNKPVTVARSGTAARPIVIAAENRGTAELRGNAQFDFRNAAHVVIRGFRFAQALPQVIPVGSHHVRLTGNTYQLEASVKNWLLIRGDNVEVDHNAFQNKSTVGVYVAVNGPGTGGDDTHCPQGLDIAKRTKIHHNYFFNHSFDGGNGGESIRLGDSCRARLSAHTLVEFNLFERANGDPEAISSKSTHNVIRFNTIRDSRGCIVLRQADRNHVYGNFVVNSSCGIRIYGDDHSIFNNFIVGSTNRAITIGSGTVRDLLSTQPNSEYDAPNRVRLVFNTLVNNAQHIAGEDRPFAPSDIVIANNIIQGSTGTLVFHRAGFDAGIRN